MPSILDYQAYYDAANNRALSPITQGQRQELALAIQALNAQQRQELVAREAAERAKGYQEQARLESSLQEEAFQRRTNDARSAVKVYQNDLAEIAQRIEAYGQVPISEQVEALKLNKKLADYLEEKGITSGGVPQRGGSLIPFIQTLIDNNEVPDAVSKEARNWFDSVKERTLANTDEGKREVAALQREYGNIGNRIDALIGAFPGAADAITLPEQAPKPSAGGLTDEALAEIAGGPPPKKKKDEDPGLFGRARDAVSEFFTTPVNPTPNPVYFNQFGFPNRAAVQKAGSAIGEFFNPFVGISAAPEKTVGQQVIDLLNYLPTPQASPAPTIPVDPERTITPSVPIPRSTRSLRPYEIQQAQGGVAPGYTPSQVIEALNSYR